MEEFVVEIKENMKKDKNKDAKYTLNRRCLSLVLSNDPPEIINLREGKDTGDLIFAISLKEFGMSEFDVYEKYKSVILNPYIGNFLGEFLIRENIDKFAKVLTDLDSAEYIPVVNSWNHKKFGIEFSGNLLNFYFHVSLIQKILMEDFRESI